MAKASLSRLSLHKNTVERRRKKELADNVVQAVRNTIEVADIRAYAFVAIDAKGGFHAAWDTGSILPMWAFPATIEVGLRDDIERSGVEETWRPNLTLKG